MATIGLSGLTEEEKKHIENQAEEQNLDTAEWCRYRLRAGYRLWDAGGNFDIKEVQQRLDLDSPDRTNDESVSPAGRFKQVIKRNLSIDEAMDRDEIEDLIAKQAVGQALSELRDEGEIRYSDRKGGYVRE